jgi:DNA-binding CsgD family transcriptional regulator
MRALDPELVERIAGRRGEVLACIWAGMSTKEIGVELGISPKTVEFHRARLYRDFGVNDLVSLCRRAIALELIDPKSEGAGPKQRMPEAMPDAMPTHVRIEAEREESAGAASASFERTCRKPSNLKGSMPEVMPQAMPHVCHPESESE